MSCIKYSIIALSNHGSRRLDRWNNIEFESLQHSRVSVILPDDSELGLSRPRSHCLGSVHDVTPHQPYSQHPEYGHYAVFVNWLESIAGALHCGEDIRSVRRRFLGIAAASTPGLINLVKNKDARALVAQVHFQALAMIKDLGDWFMAGVPEYHIRGYASLFPREWAWAMEWPLSTIS